ncbi:TetR/AcrR family transcriptional regulator [Actinokineospora sp. G85]|uniref:TetR/AcrR family transcriptional regulator n=1 Tax=Actinokineospora sp. G85 TaxID=3406626 RepID=UPI003C7141B7
MGAGQTARERARAELTSAIKDEARRQLATDGPSQLSLRAVARALGMASSAIYRYFPSRDELLTALIIDAYDALGAAVEAVEPDEPAAWWHAVCAATRAWALANRHEYELIFGSPIPGYRAPVDTVAPAARVPLTLVRVAEAADLADEDLPEALRAQLTQVLAGIGSTLPPGAMARLMTAWTQLFGMLSFELFGQLVGSADPADHFFAHAVDEMARFLGLHPAGNRPNVSHAIGS